LRAELNVRDNGLVAIYAGRLTDGKNPMLLAQAVAALRRSGQPWVGLFVGDGSQKDLIGSTDGCQVVGFVQHDELAQYYRAADVAVWPEQESMSMLDAMSSGLPLIVSSSMGDLDRVVGNGLTFTQGSVEGLTAVLSGLANSDERRQLGVTARAKAEKQYSWDSNARRREADYAASVERHHES
jgi:glycosyltransferase involved in cell wall biosynthesis